MTIIRHATPDDFDALLAMGENFYRYSQYSNYVEFNEEALRNALHSIMENGVIFVAELNGEVIGGIAGAIGPIWVNPLSRLAIELAWWIKEEHRGGLAAIKVYRRFEQWAWDSDCTAIIMSDLVINGENPVGPLFEKLGFAHVERAHIKRRES